MRTGRPFGSTYIAPEIRLSPSQHIYCLPSLQPASEELLLSGRRDSDTSSLMSKEARPKECISETSDALCRRPIRTSITARPWQSEGCSDSESVFSSDHFHQKKTEVLESARGGPHCLRELHTCKVQQALIDCLPTGQHGHDVSAGQAYC